jgi:tetratricopeptide (TPR) repeat protein
MMDHNWDEKSNAELEEIIAGDDPEPRGYALLEMAHRMHLASDYRQVSAYAEAAREAFHTNEQRVDEALAAYVEARANRSLDDYDAAIAAADVAAAINREYGRDVELGDALNLRANCLERLNRLDEAEPAYLEAVDILFAANRITQAGIALLNVGEIQGRTDRITESLMTFQRALSVFTEGSDFVGVGRAHDRIAASLIEMGQLDDAVEHLREALRLFEYLDEEWYWFNAKYRLGWTLVTCGQTEEAIPLLSDAATHYKSKGEFVRAAECDIQIAHAFSAEGRYAEAEDLYRKTRAVFAGAGKLSDARFAEGNLAINLGRQARYSEAIPIYRRLIEEAQNVGDDFGFRSLTTRLANELRNLDTFVDVEESLKVLDSSPVEDWGDHTYERILQLGAYRASHAWLGRDEEAEQYAKAILEFPVESSYMAYIASSYATLGKAADLRGESAKADQLIAQAVAMFLADGEDESARELSRRFLVPGNVSGPDVLRPEGDSPVSQTQPSTGEITVIPPADSPSE